MNAIQEQVAWQKDMATGKHRSLMERAIQQVLVNQVLILERVMKSRDNWTDEHRQAVQDSRGLIAELE